MPIKAFDDRLREMCPQRMIRSQTAKSQNLYQRTCVVVRLVILTYSKKRLQILISMLTNLI